ncbi:MAG: 4Fe-4S ferredoxin [Actinobacteria bacterium]|nr:4Fe-4S ferredoxin [Actinomycetota bacterium]
MFDNKYLEKLKKSPGYPSEERLGKGPVAVIECLEEIPCNPCETVCPKKSIKVGKPITNLPEFNDICNGCGKCMVICPGLAIFMVDKSFSDIEAAISIPYELLPLPGKGDKIIALNRNGEDVCEGRVERVKTGKSFNKTNIITISVPKNFSDEVRFFKLTK